MKLGRFNARHCPDFNTQAAFFYPFKAEYFRERCRTQKKAQSQLLLFTLFFFIILALATFV